MPIYLAAVPILVVLGLGGGLQWVLNQVLVMGLVDDRYRGRVMSIYMLTFGLMPLAVLPAGIAVDLVGAPLVIGVMGLGLFAASAAVLLTQGRLRALQ